MAEVSIASVKHVQQTIPPVRLRSEAVVGGIHIRTSVSGEKSYVINGFRVYLANKHHIVKLDERQLEICWLAGSGLQNGGIAKRMKSTEHVIKNELKDIYDIIGVNNRVELGMWANKNITARYDGEGRAGCIRVHSTCLYKPRFSLKEIVVLSGVREGLSNRKIGDRYGMSERTVKEYCNQLFSKARVSRHSYKRLALALWAERNQCVKEQVDNFDAFMESIHNRKGIVRYREFKSNFKELGIKKLGKKEIDHFTEHLPASVRSKIVSGNYTDIGTRKKILEAHADPRKLSLRQAAIYTGTKEETISRHWRIRGLRIYGGQFGTGNQKRITDEQRRKIFEGHDMRKSELGTARYAKVDVHTVHIYWKRAKLKPYGKVRPPITEGQKRRLEHARNVLGLSYKKCGKRAGVVAQTAHNYLRSLQLDEYQKRKLEHARHVLGLSNDKCGELAGVSEDVASFYLKSLKSKSGRCGHLLRGEGSRNLALSTT